MYMIKNFFGHLGTITKHRHKVLVHCIKCGILWRGLVHDLSKFSPEEFWESVKYYNGKHSPISDCRHANGYSRAWLHHKGRNKHHPEYWYDEQNKAHMDMPYKYAVEMVCDMIAAGKTYCGKDWTPDKSLQYWLNKKDVVTMSANTTNFVTRVMLDLVAYGEKKVFNRKYMKRTYKDMVMDKKELDLENIK